MPAHKLSKTPSFGNTWHSRASYMPYLETINHLTVTSRIKKNRKSLWFFAFRTNIAENSRLSCLCSVCWQCLLVSIIKIKIWLIYQAYKNLKMSKYVKSKKRFVRIFKRFSRFPFFKWRMNKSTTPLNRSLGKTNLLLYLDDTILPLLFAQVFEEEKICNCLAFGTKY